MCVQLRDVIGLVGAGILGGSIVTAIAFKKLLRFSPPLSRLSTHLMVCENIQHVQASKSYLLHHKDEI